MKAVFLLFVSILFQNIAMAQNADEKELTSIVETLRKAMVDADKTTLEKIASENLSYGHSSGLVEDKATFVHAIVSGKFGFTKLIFSDVKVKVTDNVAIVRHKMSGDALNDGKPGPINIGVMLVFQKAGGNWKLVGRQAFKL
jgi:hypothetical protein